MYNQLKSILFVSCFSLPQLSHSEAITDIYSTGDTLTASKLNNIKSAVNDNDVQITALETNTTSTLDNIENTVNNNDTRITALEAATGTNYTLIESAPMNAPALGDASVLVGCPTGIAISGGFTSGTNAFRVRDNGPNQTLTAWNVHLYNTSASSRSFIASVICAN